MAIPCDMLLHPELLSNEQLLQIIQERHLRIENLKTKERQELLEIFHRYCVPYGQRKQRDTRRGNTAANNSSDTVNNYLNSRKKPHPSSASLKPSDGLSGHMKRIKLECNAGSVINTNKRKMSIDAVPSDSPPVKKERKPITWP